MAVPKPHFSHIIFHHTMQNPKLSLYEISITLFDMGGGGHDGPQNVFDRLCLNAEEEETETW